MGGRPKKNYRKVSLVISLYTAADLVYLTDADEWTRVFRWMKPGDAYTDQEKFRVVSVKKNLPRKRRRKTRVRLRT